MNATQPSVSATPHAVANLQAHHHPMVQEACRVATPVVRARAVMPWSKGDPDRLVMVSCLVSFLVLPFVL